MREVAVPLAGYGIPAEDVLTGGGGPADATALNPQTVKDC
jgi:hypothetical protein